MTEKNRRRYFRIIDELGVSYRILDADRERCDESNNQSSSAQILADISRDLSASINNLWKNNPTAANVIGLLNKKLDFITDEIGTEALKQSSHQHRLIEVNISACGIAFECSQLIDIGRVLDLTLTLQPTNAILKLRSCVTSCDAVQNKVKDLYLLRLDFVNVDTYVREELIQYIVRRQSFQLKKRDKGKFESSVLLNVNLYYDEWLLALLK